MNIESREQRRKLLDLLWDHASRVVEGPDSQGAGVDPEEVWTMFNRNLAEAGFELDLVGIVTAPESEPGALTKEQLSVITTGHTLPTMRGARAKRGS